MRAKQDYNARMNKEKEIPYWTRYPKTVLEEMRKLAKEHGRSLNGEIVWALREYIQQQTGARQHAP